MQAKKSSKKYLLEDVAFIRRQFLGLELPK
jgi:hypothetical protein